MPTILLLEKDPALRSALARALTSDEDHVFALDSLAAAHDALTAFAPDLVVCSVELEDGSGYELARAIRARHGDRVGVLLVTAAGEEPMLALLAGADDVVARPLPPQVLRSRCDRVLRLKRSGRIAVASS